MYLLMDGALYVDLMLVFDMEIILHFLTGVFFILMPPEIYIFFHLIKIMPFDFQNGVLLCSKVNFIVQCS
jgi:hypothetical protein